MIGKDESYFLIVKEIPPYFEVESRDVQCLCTVHLLKPIFSASMSSFFNNEDLRSFLLSFKVMTTRSSPLRVPLFRTSVDLISHLRPHPNRLLGPRRRLIDTRPDPLETGLHKTNDSINRKALCTQGTRVHISQ